jgi:hypothetical protein
MAQLALFEGLAAQTTPAITPATMRSPLSLAGGRKILAAPRADRPLSPALPKLCALKPALRPPLELVRFEHVVDRF